MGPNTGGMGAYCPCPLVDEKQLNYVQKEVLERTINGLQKENIKFVGTRINSYFDKLRLLSLHKLLNLKYIFFKYLHIF